MIDFININENISGLVGSSLGGTLLSKPYRRPDIMNPEGVFDSKYMQQKANDTAITDMKENEQTAVKEIDTQPDTIIPNDSVVAKMLDQNNITDTIKVSPRGLVPEVLFPPNSQPLPTAPKLEHFSNFKIMGTDIKLIFLIIFIIVSIVLIIKYCN
jgi:hypothetical protein